MCGIAGLININASSQASLIWEMSRLLRHRGPDDEGYLAVNTHSEDMRIVALRGPDSTKTDELPIKSYIGNANLYLGHRRLAILDCSHAGRQPMQYKGYLWIVFNGEIFNYVELRQELRAAGYLFKTGTDTEVILAAYDCWGEACVTRFNGDWAFCILDTERKMLFLSRDRYGIKPLYVFRAGQHFAFASEIKALLALPFVTRTLNVDKAFHYCALHCRDHTAETLFDNISQLIPGQNMLVDLQTGTLKTWPYYTLSYTMELGEYNHRKVEAHAADVRDLLFEAVRLRLRADVSVGTCLSGGLDSSAIVAVMGKLLGAETTAEVHNTFTAAFPGEAIDESRFARSVVNLTGAKSHFVYPSKEDYWHDLPAILFHQDEPFGSTTVYSQWEVMQEASKYVKVVLDGQGGDEVFGGYWHNRVSLLAHLLRQRRIRSLTSEIWGTMKHAGSARSALAALQPLPFYVLPSTWKRFFYCMGHRQEFDTANQAFGLKHPDALDHIERKFSAHFNEVLFYYLTAYSLPYLLKAEDRNSMAHSIEARVPFMDYRLVDYVFALPAIYKVRHGWTKWILRLAVKDLLPPEIVWRKDKLGFATPSWASRQEEWMAWIGLTFNDHPATSTNL